MTYEELQQSIGKSVRYLDLPNKKKSKGLTCNDNGVLVSVQDVQCRIDYVDKGVGIFVLYSAFDLIQLLP